MCRRARAPGTWRDRWVREVGGFGRWGASRRVWGRGWPVRLLLACLVSGAFPPPPRTTRTRTLPLQLTFHVRQDAPDEPSVRYGPRDPLDKDLSSEDEAAAAAAAEEGASSGKEASEDGAAAAKA